MKFKSLLAGWMLATIAAACSEYEPDVAPPCNEDPWSCPDNQTCWLLDKGVGCINPSSLSEGDNCEPYVGTTECGGGLVCVKQDATKPGQCRASCSTIDASHVCPDGFACRTTVIASTDGNNYEFQVCMPL